MNKHEKIINSLFLPVFFKNFGENIANTFVLLKLPKIGLDFEKDQFQVQIVRQFQIFKVFEHENCICESA